MRWNLPIESSDAEQIVNILFEGIKGKYKKKTTEISQLLSATNPSILQFFFPFKPF